jgi:hypothetical protein
MERHEKHAHTHHEAKKETGQRKTRRRQRPRRFFQGNNGPRPKSNDIETPPGICQFLHDIIQPHYDARVILDPCAGEGNLTKPWDHTVKKIVSYEIKQGQDFFKCNQKLNDVDLVLCNPPFNGNPDSRELFPWKFLRHILAAVPQTTPIVLFVPFGFLLNVRMRTNGDRTNRYSWLRDNCPPVTSFVPLPKNIFASPGEPERRIDSLILLFNMPKLESCYFVPEQYLSPGRNVLLDSLAEWIEDARDSDEDHRFVESIWSQSGFDPQHLTDSIRLLPQELRAIWASLRNGVRSQRPEDGSERRLPR